MTTSLRRCALPLESPSVQRTHRMTGELFSENVVGLAETFLKPLYYFNAGFLNPHLIYIQSGKVVELFSSEPKQQVLRNKQLQYVKIRLLIQFVGALHLSDKMM